MRKLFSFNMMTLDGFFAGENGDFSWPNVDAEFNEFAIAQLETIGTLIFGRTTYEMMASYWPMPDAVDDDPIVANLMNNMSKIVVSKSLQTASWNNTTLISDNAAEEIKRLKQQSGKDMAVFGSADLLSSLIQQDLVDEHRVMINPVIIGSGIPLFKSSDGKFKLRLTNSKIFNSGNVLLYYEPISKAVSQ